MTRKLTLLRAVLFSACLASALSWGAGVAAGQDAPSPQEKKDAPAEPAKPAEAPKPASIPGGAPPWSPTTLPTGVTREQMWAAPTAEDWKKPCLITFQRTWEDAVAVARETQKPILVCINMDGEIASEHWAGVRYRMPEVAALYEPYVCVIASVYRHTPRDYDDEGKRVLCPRFGSVTCGEHIAIEPGLHDKYMEGRRISPRHIMVELDGSEKFDVYHTFDTASVQKVVTDGIANRSIKPPTIVRGDRPIVERVASNDIADRVAVEAAYQKGDAPLRKSLLDAAGARGGSAPIELLRLAIFGLDPELSRQARATLAQTASPDAANLIVDSLRVPMAEAEREALLTALERLGETSVRAQWLAVVHRGLSTKTTALDVKAWKQGGGEYQAAALPAGWGELDAERASKAKAARTRPEDPAVRLELAEAYLAMAMEARKVDGDGRAARTFTQALLADARLAALRAEKLGATGWRVNTALALAAYYSNDVEEAYARAAAAMKDLPPGEASWNSMAVLTVYAESRWKAIKAAVHEEKRPPAQLLADLNAVNTVLLRHPLGTDSQAVWHYDFLVWLRAFMQAPRYLEEALARFPESTTLHERLRTRLLDREGVDALEAAYDAMLQKKDAHPALASFAGLASTVAGDFHRRAGARDKALAAYERAIAHYDRAATSSPGNRDAADHAVALAKATRSRLFYEMNDDERALAEIVASFERRPASAGSKDGAGFTPAETGQMLLSRLKETKRVELAGQLEAAMAKLEPQLLRPDRE